MTTGKLIDRITTPHQLRRLTDRELVQLADELRQRIIEVVSRTGGHLASNLGIAELTIALHYVFDFTHDRLLWDVGHQCYAHKLLTGRAGRFGTLRQAGGLSGFPAPDESEYDLFATGHAGTAISTAAGLAWGDLFAGRDSRIVAIVGDASIVNGLSLEGLNNVATLKRQLLIILNDNSMAIDRTQGGLAAVLDRVRLTHTYADMKRTTENILKHVPLGHEISDALARLRAGLKSTIHGGQMFEALGLEYFGPINGHDVNDLIRVLRRLSEINSPVILHVHTEKGRGCSYAVEDPCRFHSPPAWKVHNGNAVFAEKVRPTWTEVFSQSLVRLARKDRRIVAITAAMPDGTGLDKFREEFPDRYIDVGISESHAVAMAAGLAKTGLRPVVAVYSTFMQRAFDQIFHEVAFQNLPVLLCMDRAGLVGSDGPVHHGFVDIAYLRAMPGMTLLAPADAGEMYPALEFAIGLGSPAAIRYPRDEAPADIMPADAAEPFELGKACLVRQGGDGTFLCYGAMVEEAMDAREILDRDGLKVGLVNARFAKPLDSVLIGRLAAAGGPVLTVEDHALAGGFGSAVLELAAARGFNVSAFRPLGLPDRFIAHASRQQQLAEVGLDPVGLAREMKDAIARKAADRTRSLP
ncbi:MAG: 1-deoxy-D-xylulose-5-phosphate synthase [Planctomycetes bacterium]|nr:1-deoxy-D-xylulose-5-phosphate synthase [Planctomycetota bacterium]